MGHIVRRRVLLLLRNRVSRDSVKLRRLVLVLIWNMRRFDNLRLLTVQVVILIIAV